MMARALQGILIILILMSMTVGQAVAQPRGERPRPQLNLSDKQEAKLRQALRKTQGESERTSRALTDERRRLFATYGNYKLDQGSARDSITRINQLQVELLNLSMERQKALRRVLSPEEFRQIRTEVRRPERGPGPAADGMGDQDDGSRGHRLPQLNLDPEQQKEIERLWQKSNRDSESIYREMGAKLRAIDRLYDDYLFDEKAARRLISDMNRLQRQSLHNRLDRQIEMRKILSEQQFKELARQTRKPPFPRGRGRR